MANIDVDGEDSERVSAATGPGNPSMDEEHKIARYVEEIELYDKEVQRWDRQSKRIIKRYKDDRGGDGTIESQERRFNVLWSNTQNLLPALYARNPKPDIQRRFKDADPVGRVTSDVLERSVSYFCDTDHFAGTSRQCVLDYLLPGRGTLWVRYVPHFKPAEEITDDVGPGDSEEEQAQAPEVIDYEEVIPDYVHRQDFGHNICRTWDEVWLVWRKVYLTRKELIARFGEEKGKLPPLDYQNKDSRDRVIDDGVSKSIIFEAWDRIKKVAVWFHKTVPDDLDMRPDPLGLQDFFPCPKPLFTNLVNDSLIPTPMYVEYQDQAAELDLLTARIAMMTRCLKIVGIYDASVEGLNRMFNEGTENELIPVQSWAGMQEKGGLSNAYSLVDIKMIAETLLAAYQARDKVKEDLNEITGMADIVRGATDPDETASAQKLKAGYAGQRISDLQRDVQRFIRETIRIMVGVIANHFQIETIKQISGVRLLTNAEKQAYQASQQPPMMGHNGGPPMPGQPPQGAPMPPPAPPPLPPGVTPDQMQDMLNNPSWEDVEALIRNNALRNFRIDIETDSTIKTDETQDKQDASQLVQSLSALLKEGMQAGQQDPDIIPIIGQTIQFSLRRFNVGKEFESTVASYIQKKEKEAANPQPKPNPEMAKIQADTQANQAKLQGDMQLAREKAQLDARVAQAQQAAQAQQSMQENKLEAQREARKLEAETQLEREKMQSETNLEIQKAYIQQKTAIVVARIAAGAADGAAEEAEADEKLGIQKPKIEDALNNMAEQHGNLAGAINNLAQAHHAGMLQNANAASQNAQAVAEHSRQIGNLHKAVTSEKEIVRDPKSGKPTGVRIKPGVH